MKSDNLKRSVAALAIAAALGGAYSIGAQNSWGNAQAAPSQQTTAQFPAVTVNAALPDMSAIVAANGPAVVNIAVSGTHKTGLAQQGLPQLDPNDPFYQFFRQFRVPGRQAEQVRGQGSGFIVSPNGTILTNAHVVEDADEVTVKLTDKREFQAKVIGMDKDSDVAVLKIKADNLPTVRIGKAASSRVGEWVLAIGSPFGFENSASAGIISAKSRLLPDGSYVPFIQTDVAVNPGNSGGPLFNMAGEVIGINSQIYSRSGGYQGLSFAIPIELAMNIEQQITTTGKVQRGRLGITIQEVNQSLAESFGLKNAGGALVSNIDKNSPAAKAGLEPGDVILAIDGRDIGSSGELPAIVAGMSPGQSARLKVWRHGSPRDIEIKIGSFSDGKLASAAPAADQPKGRLGVAVRPLTPEEQRQNGSSGGLVVEEASGAAARAGIQPGDVILSVNGEKVTSVDQLRALVAKAPKRAAILLERGDSRLFVPVDLG